MTKQFGWLQALQLFGVKLVGVNAENGKRLLFSIVLIVSLSLLVRVLRWVAQRETRDKSAKRVAFWTHQGISIVLAIIMIVGVSSRSGLITRPISRRLQVGLPPVVSGNGAHNALPATTMEPRAVHK